MPPLKILETPTLLRDNTCRVSARPSETRYVDEGNMCGERHKGVSG